MLLSLDIHENKYKNCTSCDLYKTRKQTVLYRLGAVGYDKEKRPTVVLQVQDPSHFFNDQLVRSFPHAYPISDLGVGTSPSGSSLISNVRPRVKTHFRTLNVLFIGEAPGASENSRGFPFEGPSGSFLAESILGAWESAAQSYEWENQPYFGENESDPGESEQSPLTVSSDTETSQTTSKSVPPLLFAYTNVIACIPWNETRSGVRQPTKQEVAACGPRLEHLQESVCSPPNTPWSFGPEGTVSYRKNEWGTNGPAMREVDPPNQRQTSYVTLGEISRTHLLSLQREPDLKLAHPSHILRQSGPKGQIKTARFVAELAKHFSKVLQLT